MLRLQKDWMGQIICQNNVGQIELGYKVSLWPTQNIFVLVNIYFDSIGIRLGLNPPSLILNLKKSKWKQKSITKRLEKAKVPNIFHTASESVSLWPT